MELISKFNINEMVNTSYTCKQCNGVLTKYKYDMLGMLDATYMYCKACNKRYIKFWRTNEVREE
jgi:uncharacterized protein with PIN domain